MSRDLEKYCPEIYSPIGKIYRRISEDVIELNKGNYWCSTRSLPIIGRKKGDPIMISRCFSSGWVLDQ